MIISINDLIEMCVEQTGGTIRAKELMKEYHLRWNNNGISYPVNDVTLDTTNKEIEMWFNQEKILLGMNNDDGDNVNEEKERFTIVRSKLWEYGHFIQDNEKEYIFPTTEMDLYTYVKVLNEQNKRIRELEEKLFIERTKNAYDRTVEKKEHTDTVYDFKKKLDMW